MKLWIDDVRPAPEGYHWARSVEDAMFLIQCAVENNEYIELIDLDHDSGDYYAKGGDYIEVLNLLEILEYNFPIRIHSMNPVGVANMRRIIERNGWTEVK